MTSYLPRRNGAIQHINGKDQESCDRGACLNEIKVRLKLDVYCGNSTVTGTKWVQITRHVLFAASLKHTWSEKGRQKRTV